MPFWWTWVGFWWCGATLGHQRAPQGATRGNSGMGSILAPKSPKGEQKVASEPLRGPIQKRNSKKCRSWTQPEPENQAKPFEGYLKSTFRVFILEPFSGVKTELFRATRAGPLRQRRPKKMTKETAKTTTNRRQRRRQER